MECVELATVSIRFAPSLRPGKSFKRSTNLNNKNTGDHGKGDADGDHDRILHHFFQVFGAATNGSVEKPFGDLGRDRNRQRASRGHRSIETLLMTELLGLARMRDRRRAWRDRSSSLGNRRALHKHALSTR